MPIKYPGSAGRPPRTFTFPKLEPIVENWKILSVVKYLHKLRTEEDQHYKGSALEADVLRVIKHFEELKTLRTKTKADD